MKFLTDTEKQFLKDKASSIFMNAGNYKCCELPYKYVPNSVEGHLANEFLQKIDQYDNVLEQIVDDQDYYCMISPSQFFHKYSRDIMEYIQYDCDMGVEAFTCGCSDYDVNAARMFFDDKMREFVIEMQSELDEWLNEQQEEGI